MAAKCTAASDIERREHDGAAGAKKVLAFGYNDETASHIELNVDSEGNFKTASLIKTLQELNQRLAPLAGAMANTAQLRVVQSSVPSTAVTGPITSAQSIAEKAVAGISYTQRVALENMNAVHSNINNVTA